jgi:hypothetical protein
MTTYHTQRVLDEITVEREDQDERWGEQNHPILIDPDWVYSYLARAEDWKEHNDASANAGALGWDGILLEEVYEALSETDPEKRREELIQVAAVAVAAVESEDRRYGRAPRS